MNVLEAMQNALEFLESLGYKGGDIHDDLKNSIDIVENYRVANHPLPTEHSDVANRITGRIWRDLTDRRGLKHALEARGDTAIQLEFKEAMATIADNELSLGRDGVEGRIVTHVLAELNQNGNFRHEFDQCDGDVRDELKATLAGYVMEELAK